MSVDIIARGIASNKADLVGGKVPASQLPSYVDDVIEVESYAALPNPGEAGKIYVTKNDNKTYRWSGSTYIAIGGGSSYTAGDGITISDSTISVTSGKFVERKESTADRLVAYQDNTGLQKQIAVVWDSDNGSLTTSEFIATTTGGGAGKITAVDAQISGNITDGTNSVTVANIAKKDAVVTLADAQSITGIKSFSVPVLFTPADNTFIKLAASADTYSDTLKFISGNSTGTTPGFTELDVFYNYNTGRKVVMPSTDGDVELGRTDKRFKQLFVSGAIRDGDATGSNAITVAQMVAKSTVSASSTGTSTTEAKYLTVDGTEYKLSAAAESQVFTAVWVPGGEQTSFDDIKTAYDAGKIVRVKYYDSSHQSWHYCNLYCEYTCGSAATDPGLTYFFRGATISDPELWSPAPADIFIACFKINGVTSWTKKA